MGFSTVSAWDTGDSWGPGRDSRTSQVCSQHPMRPDSCCLEAPLTRAQGHSAKGPSSVSLAHPGNGMNCGAQNFGVYSNTAGLPTIPQWKPHPGFRGLTPSDAPSRTPTSKSPGGWHSTLLPPCPEAATLWYYFVFKQLSLARTDTPFIRTLTAQHRVWHTVGPQQILAE